ncbi:MAG: NAD-dependent epimerase/dehydratase family protein [Acidobacteria bacterium]|nr:NAD-dependent epimerase/dehydratase family protein [Acidobacteriota bacterium]
MGFWQQRRVLVTGGAGFIGSNLVDHLLEAGAQVRVVDNLARQGNAQAWRPNWHGEAEFRCLDLRDPVACRQACTGCEVVFHLAARAGSVGYYQKHPGRVLTENLLLDTQLLAASLTAGVEAYFYASSSMVYPLARQQTPQATPLREEKALPADPPNSYGWAKLIGERGVVQATAEHRGFRAAVLRLENVYGPGQDVNLERGSVIPVLIRRALEYPQTPFEVRGTGQETRCFCYLTDALAAMVRAVELLQEECLIGPLNVTDERRVRILDLVWQIIRLSGKEIEPTFVPHETRIWGQVLDCSQARARLGWVPQVPLREGLERTWIDVEMRLPQEEARVAG